MSQPPVPGDAVLAGPRFYITPKRRLGPGSILLALLLAFGLLLAVSHALGRSHTAGSATDDDDDDPSRVDTIYLGDPTQAPTATRPATRPNTVHPFVVVHLPRNGDEGGQIPDTPAGRLLYAWLAAFNAKDPAIAGTALHTAEPVLTAAAQVQLRQQTGGFTLLSAKEIQPGLLVFRLQDQNAIPTEALGTLQLNATTTPPSIASLSLRALPQRQTKGR